MKQASLHSDGSTELLTLLQQRYEQAIARLKSDTKLTQAERAQKKKELQRQYAEEKRKVRDSFF